MNSLSSAGRVPMMPAAAPSRDHADTARQAAFLERTQGDKQQIPELAASAIT
jgi:hypothetical protein